MHEMSIAVGIVEGLTEELANEEGEISSVRLRIGALSGVVPEALEFSWDIACRETRLEGSALDIEYIEAGIWCDQCEREQTLPSSNLMLCPVCDTPALQVTAGRELEIHSVEMIDHEPA